MTRRSKPRRKSRRRFRMPPQRLNAIIGLLYDPTINGRAKLVIREVLRRNGVDPRAHPVIRNRCIRRSHLRALLDSTRSLDKPSPRDDSQLCGSRRGSRLDSDPAFRPGRRELRRELTSPGLQLPGLTRRGSSSGSSSRSGRGKRVPGAADQ